MRAGFATSDITPPIGTPMAGYPDVRRDLPWTPDAMKGYVGRRRQVSTAVHDPLLACALALESDDGERAVLLGLDTLVVTRAFTARLRTALAPLGVAPEHVLVGASHTHSGPDLFAWWEGTEASAPAEATLAATIDAAKRALERLEPAALAFGEGALDYASVNRRDEAAGPIDPAVSVLRADAATGEPLALAVVFACHPVTLDYANLAFSADYVASFRKTLSAASAGAGALFLNGAAGNLNPARFPYEQRANVYVPQTLENYPVYWGGFGDAERLGRTLAGAALQAAERATPLAGAAIAGATASVRLPLKAPERVGEFLDFMSFRDGYRAALTAAGRELETEVQLVRVGDLALYALPGEPFVELGLELKRRAGGRAVVVGFANDDVRYVMTDDAYVAGQYETVGTPLDAGSADALVAAAAALGAQVTT